jgi:hypothetical protein
MRNAILANAQVSAADRVFLQESGHCPWERGLRD